MSVEDIQKNSLRFSLVLKAHTKRKRVLEAKRELAGVYPFEVKEDHILIIKGEKKGFYDVFITEEKICQTIDRKKALSSVLGVLAVLIVLFVCLHQVSLKNRQNQISQREKERQRQEAVRVLKEKEKKLEELIKEYDIAKEEGYEKMYVCLERLYSVMTQKTTVENLAIEKNTFSVEVTTKDALKILSNFEGSGAFSSIKMNRTTVKNGVESVTYNGNFSRHWDHTEPSLTVDEKIDFYQQEIDRMNRRTMALHEKQLSEYIKGIRNVLRKNNCAEQYIQLRGKEKNAEVEFFILSSSRSILNFIKEIQDEGESLVDIKSLRIRNSEDRNRIQTTVCFDSGIELKKEGEQQSEYEVTETNLSDMERIFYKKAAPKPAVIKSVRTVQKAAPKQKAAVRYLKKLSFIGITKSNGRTLVMAKDEDMGSIYKLILVDEEIGGDCCVASDTGYKAKIRGEYYEVKR
ncbi:MAG: hypothetical protein Q4B64_01830 [Spirochaetales bacterium]|nr:hypothetical protein [Spirochaetales bacterium]